MKVFILVIDHRHGTDINAFDSQEKLDAALFAYCDGWWDREMCNAPKPADPAVLIEAYWEHQSNYGDEWHQTEEIEL